MRAATEEEVRRWQGGAEQAGAKGWEVGQRQVPGKDTEGRRAAWEVPRYQGKWLGGGPRAATLSRRVPPRAAPPGRAPAALSPRAPARPRFPLPHPRAPIARLPPAPIPPSALHAPRQGTVGPALRLH